MKRLLFIMVVCFLGNMTAFAQGNEKGNRKEKLESYRTAFISERLALTPEEAEKFWPIYRQLQDQRKALVKNYKPTKLPAEMTDSEADAFINAQLEREEKMLQLKKEYAKKFKTAIPAKKVARLQQIEGEFKKDVLKRMKEHHHKGKYLRNRD